MAKTSRRNLTFELPHAVYEELETDAETRGSKSVHQRAREIVVDHFGGQDLGEIQEQLTELDSRFTELAELIRRLAYSVIVHAAGKQSSEANKWIRENMPAERPKEARKCST